MKTPTLVIQRVGAEPHLLYGSRASYAAKTDGIVTIKPVGDDAVSIRVPRRATSLHMHAGETLTLTVAAGETIEIV